MPAEQAELIVRINRHARHAAKMKDRRANAERRRVEGHMAAARKATEAEAARRALDKVIAKLNNDERVEEPRPLAPRRSAPVSAETAKAALMGAIDELNRWSGW
jgi:hypothetical protein